MASIRNLKKEIDSLVVAVVDNYCICGAVSNVELNETIKSMLRFRDDARRKINSRQKFENAKERRNYYKAIMVDALNTVDNQFIKLSETIKSFNEGE